VAITPVAQGGRAAEKPPEARGPAAAPKGGTMSAKEERELEDFAGSVSRDLQAEWCTTPPKPGCDEIKAFAAGGLPARLARATFTIGSEVGVTGRFMLLRFQPEGKDGLHLSMATLTPDDAAEDAEAHRYIDSIARGRRDTTSPVHAFGATLHSVEVSLAAEQTTRSLWLHSAAGALSQVNILLRQKDGRLYMLKIELAGHHFLKSLTVFPAP
jgi:hypothetical protein